jgi:O-glycosyl hydrolase
VKDATYLLKCAQAFQSQGLTPYAISIQNEPQNSDSTYPSATIDAATEGQIGTALRSLLNSNGLNAVKIIGFDHNWADAGDYPITLMNDAGNAFDGVSFHW